MIFYTFSIFSLTLLPLWCRQTLTYCQASVMSLPPLGGKKVKWLNFVHNDNLNIILDFQYSAHTSYLICSSRTSMKPVRLVLISVEEKAKYRQQSVGGGGRRRPWKTPAGTIQVASYRIDAPGPAASESAFVSQATLAELTAGVSFIMHILDFFFFFKLSGPLILNNRQLKSSRLKESSFFSHLLHSQMHAGQKFREAWFKMAAMFCYGKFWFLKAEVI